MHYWLGSVTILLYLNLAIYNFCIKMSKKGLLERLAAGPVVGDGSMIFTLEKRGYATVGSWTPEAVIEYPDAVRQLLREYLRAGADVLQAPCFYASSGKLERYGAPSYSADELNKVACQMAKAVAGEGDALVCGGLSPVQSFAVGKEEEAIRKEFRDQVDVFTENKVDFILAEFFQYIEEIEICIDEMKRSQLPVCATMAIGPVGDVNGVSLEECAVRMARAGADVVGLNCKFDIDSVLKCLKRIKVALDKEGLSPYIMCQPLGFRCPDVENEQQGYAVLPDAPINLDGRICTRTEIHKFTRSAFEIGTRYIGGCCGMEPHHIRAIAQELIPERNKVPPCQEMCPPHGKYLKHSNLSNLTKKAFKEFWWNLKPGSGRPFSAPCQEPEICNVLK